MNNVNIPATERTFAEKMLELYRVFAYVQKTGKNSHFKYRFFQESVMKRKLNEACRELGLVLREVEVEPVGECTGKSAVVKVRITICNDTTVSCVTLEGIGGGMDSGDKAPMKAQVAAFKYALACGLSVETGDDPEADSSTDQSAFDEVKEAIEAAEDLGALEMTKVRIAALKGIDGFDALKECFRARKEALQG